MRPRSRLASADVRLGSVCSGTLARWDRVELGSEEGLTSRGSVPTTGATAKVACTGPLTALICSRRVSCPWLWPPPHPLAQDPPLGPPHPSCYFWGEAEGVKLAPGGRARCFPWFASTLFVKL